MGNTQVLATKNNSRAFLVLGVGIAAASMAAIFIRLSQGEGMPSLLIAAGRLLIATLLLTPAVLSNKHYMQQVRALRRNDLALVLLSGLFLAIHFAAWVTSLEYTSVLISVVLVTTGPIWVAILEVIFLRARLPQLVIGGLVMALAGGLIIGLTGAGDTSGSASDQLIGAVLSITGAIAVAAYLVIGRKVRATFALTPYIWMVYGSAMLILLGAILVTGTQVTGYSLEGYGWVLAMGIFPQLIGHSAFNYALAYLPATYVSVSTQLESLITSIFAYIIFAELPTVGQALGGFVIICGVILASVGQGQMRRRDVAHEIQEAELAS
ncbi:MAG: DMT family transporter [Anaerolineae bacterium]